MTEVLALWTGLLLGAVGAPPAGTVTDVSVLPGMEQTQILISVDGEVEYRDFTMEGPYRLIVDVMDAHHSLPRTNFYGIDRGGVRAIRTSQYSDRIVRIVVELDEMVGYQVMPEEGRLRLSLSTDRGAFEPWSTSGDRPPVEAAVETYDPLPEALTSSTAAQEGRRITINFENAPIEDVLFTFAQFANRSIIAGSNVTGTVSASIVDQPWDRALQEILRAQGLAAEETDQGIIRVDNVTNLGEREQVQPPQTRPFPIRFADAEQIRQAVEQGILSERGSASVEPSRNVVIVTDVPRVLDAVENLINELDRRTPQVTIQAKIIFVNRTDLQEFGIRYELKDSQGNQLNVIAPGQTFDEQGNPQTVPVGTNVVSLSGNSLAALGNANNPVAGPTLTLLTSLVVGRHTLVSFIEALESVNLSEIQASPSVTVLDNEPARIVVGEDTPVRMIEQAAGGAPEGGLPTVTTQFQETGVILDVTPHITEGDNIVLQVHAERSSADLAETDAGVIFRKQLAESRVLLQDGQTMVIAGLTVTENSEVRAGIPLLMDLPFIGRLFRTTRESQVQRDLIILVTPHIIRD